MADVTADLTGISATSADGTLAQGRQGFMPGQSATASVGTLGALDETLALLGTLVPQNAALLVSSGATAGLGVFGVLVDDAIQVTLVGQAALAVANDLPLPLSIGITSPTATISAGSLVPAQTADMVGADLAPDVGAFFAGELPLTGQSMTSDAGFLPVTAPWTNVATHTSTWTKRPTNSTIWT